MSTSTEKSRVTAAEVALACGVSQPTVSQILSKGAYASRYSAATRRRVLDAAHQLGYRINTAARSVRSGRFGVVSLLLSTENGRSSMPSGLLRGIQEELMANNLRLQVSMLPDDDLIATWGVPDALTQAHSDGLLINYTHHIPAALLDAIHANRLPSVWINSRQGSNCVYPDDFGVGYDMTRLLLSRGHRRVLYIDFAHHWPLHAEHYSAVDRHAGYVKAMTDAGLVPQAIGKPPVDGPASSADLFTAAMSVADRPTGVVSYAAVRASDMHVELVRLGLRVPQDVEFSAAHTPTSPLSNMPMHIAATPDVAMGAAATRMLMQRIEDPSKSQPPYVVKFTLAVDPNSPRQAATTV